MRATAESSLSFGVVCLPLLWGLGPAPAAQGRPLAWDLAVPPLTAPLLWASDSPPPPAVSPPPGTPMADPGPSLDGLDHLRLQDGRQLSGKILTQVAGGFLFNDRASKATFVVPFDAIADLQLAHPTVAAKDSLRPPPGDPNSPSEQRLFLEAELRDLQLRYDSLSEWPGVETTVGGAAGIAVAVVILAFVGTDTIDVVFAGISGALGGLSVGSGIWQLVSVGNRKGKLQQQMTEVQQELGHLPRAALAPRGAGLAFSF